MRLKLCIFINKLFTKLLKLCKRNGSVYPGFIIYDVLKQKHILEKVIYPKYVIAVTGSSGKGSTVDLIEKVLTDNGYDVCYNKNGSNGVLACVTLILNHCSFSGKFKHDVLLLECDERHLKLIFGKNKMTHLVITNITRDQPARNGHPDIVFQDILKAIGPDTKLIINADDPQINSLTLTYSNEIITYGVGKTKDSYIKSNLVTDYAYCPQCHKKLVYDYYHYGHLGNYHCPNCHFSRGNVLYEATNVDLKKKMIQINGKDVILGKDILYAAYYTVAAYALLSSLGLEEEKIVSTIHNKGYESKRGKIRSFQNRNFMMLETKNENNLSYYQSIKYITNQAGKKTIILGFDNVSRRYQFNDLSWLWDVEFELLQDKNIDKIFVIGRFRYDLLTRLEFANIETEKIVLIDDLNDLLPKVASQSIGDIYTMVCFDMTANILQLLKESETHENN